jgi:hypothetical protein
LKLKLKFIKINDSLGILEGKIIFDFWILDILEVIKIHENNLIKDKYKYNYRNSNNELVFRYDNAPHHQNIATFPHHKQINDIAVESIEPDIRQILSEIKTINLNIYPLYF